MPRNKFTTETAKLAAKKSWKSRKSKKEIQRLKEIARLGGLKTQENIRKLMEK